LLTTVLFIASFSFAEEKIMEKISHKSNDFSITKAPILKNDLTKMEVLNSPEKREEFVRITCSIEVNGITFTAKGGNIFTSAERASEICQDRLMDALMAIF